MKSLLMAASILVWMAGVNQNGISPEDVAAALSQGRDGKTLEKKCKANGQNGFDIVLEGPIGRIMRAAREAKKKSREFTAADVTPVLGGQVLTVTTRRDATLNNSSSAVPMPGIPGVWVQPETIPDNRAQERLTMGGAYRAGIAVRSKRPGPDGPIILKPITIIFTEQSGGDGSWRPGQTGPMHSRSPLPGANMTASFDLAAFRAMPQGDVEVVAFMTDAGERTCKVNDKDRSAIR